MGRKRSAEREDWFCSCSPAAGGARASARSSAGRIREPSTGSTEDKGRQTHFRPDTLHQMLLPIRYRTCPPASLGGRGGGGGSRTVCSLHEPGAKLVLAREQWGSNGASSATSSKVAFFFLSIPLATLLDERRASGRLHLKSTGRWSAPMRLAQGYPYSAFRWH